MPIFELLAEICLMFKSKMGGHFLDSLAFQQMKRSFHRFLMPQPISGGDSKGMTHQSFKRAPGDPQPLGK